MIPPVEPQYVPNFFGKNTGRFFIGFVYLNVYFVTYQICVSSRHMAVAFDLPVHNIGIYFDKLYSSRCLALGFGTFAEYLIYRLSGNSDTIRKHISLFSIFLLFVDRLWFTLALHMSTQLSLHSYIILIFDSFFHGFFQMAVLAIAPQHTSITDLSSRLAGIVIFFLQNLLDIFLFKWPLLNIKVVSWICTFMTAASGVAWYFYAFCIYGCYTKWKLNLNKMRQAKADGETLSESEFFDGYYDDDRVSMLSTDKERLKTRKPGETTFIYHLRNCFSQFMLFGAAALFKDFLYPGILPYALLERDQTHLIHFLVVLILASGSFQIFVLHEFTPDFKYWSPLHNACWLFMIPNFIAMYLTFMAIHTRKPYAVKIQRSRPRVLTLTCLTMIPYCVMCPMGFVGVGDYVYFKSGDRRGSIVLVTCHNILSLVYRYTFSKLAAGYNDTRVSLGYTLPKFRPTHKMSKSNATWYIIRNTFKRAAVDVARDFTVNIKSYI